MKPKVYIDKESKAIIIESDKDNKIDITEAHSFIKDYLIVVFDYHKMFPKSNVGNYIP